MKSTSGFAIRPQPSILSLVDERFRRQFIVQPHFDGEQPNVGFELDDDPTDFTVGQGVDRCGTELEKHQARPALDMRSNRVRSLRMLGLERERMAVYSRWCIFRVRLWHERTVLRDLWCSTSV